MTVCLSLCGLAVLQKKRMRRTAGWSQAGGPTEILKACQEITAGRGGPLPQFGILVMYPRQIGHSSTLWTLSVLFAFKVDLSSWEQKIQRDAVAEQLDGERPDERESVLMEHQSDSTMELGSPSQELYKDGVLTLGCIGNWQVDSCRHILGTFLIQLFQNKRQKSCEVCVYIK